MKAVIKGVMAYSIDGSIEDFEAGDYPTVNAVYIGDDIDPFTQLQPTGDETPQQYANRVATAINAVFTAKFGANKFTPFVGTGTDNGSDVIITLSSTELESTFNGASIPLCRTLGTPSAISPSNLTFPLAMAIQYNYNALTVGYYNFAIASVNDSVPQTDASEAINAPQNNFRSWLEKQGDNYQAR